MEIKKKNGKETEVQVGIKGRIIPIQFVIDYKLQDLKNDIISKENQLSEIESRISEILDSLDEDERLEIDSALTEENEFISKEVAKKAKEYLKSSTSEGTIEKKIIEANSLLENQKKLTKDIKDSNKNIEIMAQKEIENLNYDDICVLLNKKWIEPIIDGIGKMINNIIVNFTKNIEKLSNKYEQTLKDVDNEIYEVEKELSKMIDELTGSEFDMKGLEDFKSLINGD